MGEKPSFGTEKKRVMGPKNRFGFKQTGGWGNVRNCKKLGGIRGETTYRQCRKGTVSRPKLVGARQCKKLWEFNKIWR